MDRGCLFVAAKCTVVVRLRCRRPVQPTRCPYIILAIGLFALASAACAVAPTVGWLLGGRLLQGLGAALLMHNSLAILGRPFSGAAKGRAIGMWAAADAVAAAIVVVWLNVPRGRQDKRDPLDVWGEMLGTGGLVS